MLQKYYEMLDKFNKKLEEKDVLISNKSVNKSPREKKIIYIKENEIANKNKSAIFKNKLGLN